MQLKVIATALVLSGSAALADVPLPSIDVEAQCRHDADEVNGGNSQFVYCMEHEQARYDELKTLWASTPDEIRKLCLSQWDHYSMIHYCVGDEIRATEKAKSLKFKK